MTKTQFVPRRASTIGIWLFLASLSMLFISSMLLYVLVRVGSESAPDFGSVKLPNSLWTSTLLILGGSFTIHRALVAIRRERQVQFRQWLTATIMFAGLFVAVQTPAMITLLKSNTAEQARNDAEIRNDSAQQNLPLMMQKKPSKIYAVVFFLILVHALHVVGGLIALGIVAVSGFRGRYDHEHHSGVRNAVLYWHFLDVVWVFMYGMIFAFK